MSTTADVIVIGGGTMGTAAGWELARSGQKVIVLERFSHVHSFGSHGGKTRIFRHNYAEGAQYVPWALRATSLWGELQERHPEVPFVFQSGSLDISTTDGVRAQHARASAQEYGLPYEWLSGKEVNERFPAWNLPDDWNACLDPTAGFLVVSPALKALATEMIAAGGELRTEEQVLSWSESTHGVTVTTDKGEYSADKLIVTAGAWNGGILGDLGLPLEVRRKPVFWFETEDESLFTHDRFPTYVIDYGAEEFYGLPVYADPGLKTGIHSGGNIVNPEAIDREVHAEDITPSFRAFVEQRFHGVKLNVVDSAVCMYTMTPDEHFIIDRYPGKERVIYAAGFSGHGFKFTPVVGEYLASLATDEHAEVLTWFQYERFLQSPE